MTSDSFMQNLPPSIIVWYDRSLRSWTAVYQDQWGNQIGDTGYGHTKADAIESVKYLRMLNGENEDD